MHAGGLDAVVMAVAVGPMPRNNTGYTAAAKLAQIKLEAVKMLATDKTNNSVIVLSTDDLITAHKEGKSALLLGFQNALILGTEIDGINDLYSSGVRVFALTHMGHNDFADSSRTHYLMAIMAGESPMLSMAAYPL